MSELNREQVKKALECLGCLNGISCTECIYNEIIYPKCTEEAARNALSLIKELTEDNEAQAETITSLLKTIEGVQGVKSEYETFIGGLKTQIDTIKAEERADTVNKMYSMIKERCIKGGIYPAFVEGVIDQIAKEMLEGKEICKNTHQKK